MAKKAAAAAEVLPTESEATSTGLELTQGTKAEKQSVPADYFPKPQDCYKLWSIECHHPLSYGQETRNKLTAEGSATIKDPAILYDHKHDWVVILLKSIPGRVKPRGKIVFQSNCRVAEFEY